MLWPSQNHRSDARFCHDDEELCSDLGSNSPLFWGARNASGSVPSSIKMRIWKRKPGVFRCGSWSRRCFYSWKRSSDALEIPHRADNRLPGAVLVALLVGIPDELSQALFLALRRALGLDPGELFIEFIEVRSVDVTLNLRNKRSWFITNLLPVNPRKEGVRLDLPDPVHPQPIPGTVNQPLDQINGLVA